MPFLSLGDSQFYYEISGPRSAPVLLFSNSLGTNLEIWNLQMLELGGEFRILRYDMRGHGKTSVSPTSYSIEQLADDVVALLNRLGIDSVFFCGLSVGGMIGMSLGARAPERIRKLVLCNTAPKIGTTDSWNARISAVEKEGMTAITDAVLERWYTSEFRKSCPEAVARTRKMLLATPVEGYVTCCAAIRDMDLRQTIGQIRVPTLVIAGGCDPVTTPADAKGILTAIRDSQYVELPAAHLSNIEAADRFTASLLTFLR